MLWLRILHEPACLQRRGSKSTQESTSAAVTFDWVSHRYKNTDQAHTDLNCAIPHPIMEKPMSISRTRATVLRASIPHWRLSLRGTGCKHAS
jgi:hypothetical protein